MRHHSRLTLLYHHSSCLLAYLGVVLRRSRLCILNHLVMLFVLFPLLSCWILGNVVVPDIHFAKMTPSIFIRSSVEVLSVLWIDSLPSLSHELHHFAKSHSWELSHKIVLSFLYKEHVWSECSFWSSPVIYTPDMTRSNYSLGLLLN